jgi:hypothetical protein
MPYPRPMPEAVWQPEDAGLVVRPYAVTSGRTRPRSGQFDLISIIAATRPAAPGRGRGPEQLAILRLCQRPASVAEVAAGVDLPVSVVRVLLGDLLDEGQIAVRQPRPAGQQLSDETLEAMIDGLRAL